MAVAVKLSESAKAFVAAVVPFVTIVVAHFAGASSDAAFLVAAGTGFLTGLGVYATPNA